MDVQNQILLEVKRISKGIELIGIDVHGPHLRKTKEHPEGEICDAVPCLDIVEKWVPQCLLQLEFINNWDEVKRELIELHGSGYITSVQQEFVERGEYPANDGTKWMLTNEYPDLRNKELIITRSGSDVPFLQLLPMMEHYQLTEKGWDRANQVDDPVIIESAEVKPYKLRITKDEANAKARQLAESDPNFTNKTQKEWAEAIGCSSALVHKLPFRQAIMERRRTKSPVQPKVENLDEIAIEQEGVTRDLELKRLTDEQTADNEPSPLDDNPNGGQFHKVKQHKQL